MGIKYAVSDHGDADGLTGEPIDQRTLDLAEALKMFVELTHDMGANIPVMITRVDDDKVVVYHMYYRGAYPSSNPELLYGTEYGFYYLFKEDPEADDILDSFHKFVFAVSSIVKAVPWIASEQVLRRVVGNDTLAYQPA